MEDELELPGIELVAQLYHDKQVERAWAEGFDLQAEDGTSIMVPWDELRDEDRTSVSDDVSVFYEALAEAIELEEPEEKEGEAATEEVAGTA